MAEKKEIWKILARGADGEIKAVTELEYEGGCVTGRKTQFQEGWETWWRAIQELLEASDAFEAFPGKTACPEKTKKEKEEP